MDDGMSVYIFKAGGRQDLRAGSAKIAFGATPPADKRFGAYLAADNIRRIEFAIPDNSYLAAKTSETMFVSANGEINETFAVPGFAGALSVLHDCVVDLGKHWGISKEDQNRVRTPAKAVQPLGNYFSTDDYPSDAIKLGGKGRTEVRLAVDSKGKPGDCVVMRPSGNKALDDVTCRVLLRKAHFHPALDLNAQPIDSVTVASVSWVLMDF